jgi:hypothetical protein
MFFLAVPMSFFELMVDLYPGNRLMTYQNKKSDLPPMAIVSSRAFFNGDYKNIRKKALTYIKSQKHESKRK